MEKRILFSHLRAVGYSSPCVMAFNNINRTAVGADDAIEQIDPGIRMGHSTARLRCAKPLSAQRDRPFASLKVTVEGPISSSVLFFETA